jgi:hypothetical protein
MPAPQQAATTPQLTVQAITGHPDDATSISNCVRADALMAAPAQQPPCPATGTQSESALHDRS